MKKQFLTRKKETAVKGTYPGSRPVEELLKNGIIILDKWCGPTSHDVTATIRKLLGASKAGHSGTLDPNVSGVLPITLDNACKVMPALQKLDKEYVGVMHLHKDVNNQKLDQAIKQFIGEITQKPPVRSAVARKERKRSIYSFEVLDKKDKDVAFRVTCEAGTYIRKLVDSIGKKIGGAHMKELRRTRVGPFEETHSVKTQDLADAYHYWKTDKNESIRSFVLPIEAAIEHLGKVIILNSSIPTILNGSPLYTTGISKIEKGIYKDDLIALLTAKGELVALAKSCMTSEQMLKKGLAAKTDRVIMKQHS